MLIDSHCHLHDREFFTAEQAADALARAKYAGVEKIICIGTDHFDSLAAADFAKTSPNIYWTYGVHPSEWRKELPKFDFNNATRLVAIGEVGLDYHYGAGERKKQIKLFNEMLQLARDQKLPVSFHIREAFDDFFDIVANFPELTGVVHSFSDNKKNLKKILETTNFYVGVNGMATYSTLPMPPLERILLETDAPFLTPAPFRKNINEPQYIKTIAEWLATKLDKNIDEISNITTANANKLFRL